MNYQKTSYEAGMTICHFGPLFPYILVRVAHPLVNINPQDKAVKNLKTVAKAKLVAHATRPPHII